MQSVLRREQRLGTHEFDWSNKGKEVALAVAQGLHFLHTSGVIHRRAEFRGAVCALYLAACLLGPTLSGACGLLAAGT